MGLLEEAIQHFSKHKEFFKGLKPGSVMVIKIEGVGAYTVRVTSDDCLVYEGDESGQADIIFVVSKEAEEELIKEETVEGFGRKLIGYYLKPEGAKRVKIQPKISLLDLSRKGYISWASKVGFKSILMR